MKNWRSTMRCYLFTLVLGISAVCYAAPAEVEYEGEVPQGFVQDGPDYEGQQEHLDEMLDDPSYDEQIPDESVESEPDFLNALYGREYDPHFSDTEELQEMMRVYKRRVGVSSDPFRIEPRQPLQSTHKPSH